MKTRRAAIYLRVSTTDQNTDNQEHELGDAHGVRRYLRGENGS
jgi:DNA invertase Pin-like site-specific DNA recombinase